MAARTSRKPLEHYLQLGYPFVVHADPDGGYVAAFPDLPGCVTRGETLAGLVEMTADARAGRIETEYGEGREIPEPGYPDACSGRFNVRIPRSLHRRLAEGAERDGVSLNLYVTSLLAQGASLSRRVGTHRR